MLGKELKPYLVGFVNGHYEEVNDQLVFAYNEAHAIETISLQMPLGIKKNRADFVVKNNFNSAKIRKEAKILLNQIII